jgi:hypothetical protein
MAWAKQKTELYHYNPLYAPPEPAECQFEKEQAENGYLAQEKKDSVDRMEKKMREFIKGLFPSLGDLMTKDFMKRQMELKVQSRPWSKRKNHSDSSSSSTASKSSHDGLSK